MYSEKASRKAARVAAGPTGATDVETLLKPAPTAEEYVPARPPIDQEEEAFAGRPHLSGEMLVVELDESHVITTNSVN